MNPQLRALPAADWAIVFGYLVAVLALAWWIARRQKSGTEYFLAGRAMRSVPLGASILANQASAVSLVGAPAFVALRPGGGLRWLQYELAVPLAMLAIIAFLLPALRSVPGASIYRYVEDRFGRAARRVVAGAFLLSRGMALGVIVYASSLVVAAATGIGTPAALLAVGLFSVAYTTLGGIVADIWSDVLQLVVLWGGTVAAALFLLGRGGVVEAIPRERMAAIDASLSGTAGTFGFVPMLIGGLFLYLSYYGCDQSQAQRLLAARDELAARRALVLNGVLRFPVVLTYCGLGLLLAGLLRSDPAFAATVAQGPPDGLVPTFVTGYLPVGLRGLLVAAILAAAMSSIDSALNSLAAVTLEDVLGRQPAEQSVWAGRTTSLAWGIFAIVAGFACSRSGTGVLELVNLVGSVFYGPLLGVFTVGIAASGVRGGGAIAGLVAGIGANLTLALAAKQISWLWWNPIGWSVTCLIAIVWSRSRVSIPKPAASRRESLLLAGAFLSMLVLLALL